MELFGGLPYIFNYLVGAVAGAEGRPAKLSVMEVPPAGKRQPFGQIELGASPEEVIFPAPATAAPPLVVVANKIMRVHSLCTSGVFRMVLVGVAIIVKILCIRQD